MTLSRSDKITIACTIASPLFTMIFDWFAGLPVFTTIEQIALFAISILTYEVPIWIVLLTILALVMCLYYLGNKKNTQPIYFNYLFYTEDMLYGYRWTWEYKYNQELNKHLIENLKAYCPKCDSILRHRSLFLDNITECVRCDFSAKGNIYGDIARIELLIIDNIQKKLKESINANVSVEQ